jgi:hypothetical protein
MLVDPGVSHRDSFAKYAAAFFTISREASIVVVRYSCAFDRPDRADTDSSRSSMKAAMFRRTLPRLALREG